MAKVTREELQNVTGEKIDALVNDQRVRLSTSPFGVAPGRVTVSIGKPAPWKRRGRVPRKLHLVDD